MYKPTIYLLCGLPGSGKTTNAKKFVSHGVVRLSLDEALFQKYGRDYPAERHSNYMQIVEREHQKTLLQFFLNKRSVVLDYGFWNKEKRNFYKKFIEKHNGQGNRAKHAFS